MKAAADKYKVYYTVSHERAVADATARGEVAGPFMNKERTYVIDLALCNSAEIEVINQAAGSGIDRIATYSVELPYRGFSSIQPAAIRVKHIIFDDHPGRGEVIDHLRRMIVEKAEAEAIYDSPETKAAHEALRAQVIAEKAAEKAETEARLEADQLAREARKEAARRPDMENGVAVINITNRLAQVAGITLDSRHTHYSREITGINPGGKGWYVFEGDFCPRKIEIRADKPSVYMLSVEHGSRRHTDKTAIAFVWEHGEFTLLEEWDQVSGWELDAKKVITPVLDRLHEKKVTPPEPNKLYVLIERLKGIDTKTLSPVDALTLLTELVDHLIDAKDES